MAERIGVFGGTFDPIHVGHLVAAVNARHALDLDRVILMVANVPWQKVGQRTVTSAEDRFALVEAAVGDVPGLEAGRLEIDRGGESHTADTLEELAELHPGAELYLDRGLGRGRRADHLGPLGGDPAAGDPRGRQPAGYRPALWPRRLAGRRGDGARRSRSPAPTCGPGPPTAGPSTTWSPRRPSTAFGPGVCTLPADDDGSSGAARAARRGCPARPRDAGSGTAGGRPAGAWPGSSWSSSWS